MKELVSRLPCGSRGISLLLAKLLRCHFRCFLLLADDGHYLAFLWLLRHTENFGNSRRFVNSPPPCTITRAVREFDFVRCFAGPMSVVWTGTKVVETGWVATSDAGVDEWPVALMRSSCGAPRIRVANQTQERDNSVRRHVVRSALRARRGTRDVQPRLAACLQPLTMPKAADPRAPDVAAVRGSTTRTPLRSGLGAPGPARQNDPNTRVGSSGQIARRRRSDSVTRELAASVAGPRPSESLETASCY